MTLEAALAANTEALNRLTAVLQSAAVPGAVYASASAPAPAAARRGKAVTPPADSTQPKGSSANPLSDADAAADLAGTPRPGNDATAAGTPAASPTAAPSAQAAAGAAADTGTVRYIHVAAHNTVAVLQPGEPTPSIAGAVMVTEAEYVALKAKYTGNANAGTSTPAAAATTAAPTASPAAQPNTPAASTSVDSGVKVMELAKALHARDGNDGLAAFLKAQGAGRVGELVSATDKHPAAIAALEALLNPAAAAAPNLF